MTRDSNPQLGPATALVQLLTEHADLPRLDWRIAAEGLFAGSLYAYHAALENVIPLATALGDVFGVTPQRSKPFLCEGGRKVEFSISATWRDVPVRVFLSCPETALAGDSAVAA